MNISLSDHFDYKKLMRFVLPPILMMIFNSFYTMVDGLFVSNLVGKYPFAALNLIFPVLSILGSFGYMVGTGGCALIAKKLGEGEVQKANEYFTMFTCFTVVLGITLSTLCFIFMPQIALLLGATSYTLNDCVLYGRVLTVSSTFYMLQSTFQNFLITAEKPKFGLVVIVCAGVSNIVLDYLFMVVFKMGLFGAALATALAQTVAALIPLGVFFKKDAKTLHFVKFKTEYKALLKGCTNGASELLSCVSASLVSILYNKKLLEFAQEDGVTAYGIIMYLGFFFAAIFIGYNIGSAPVISYNYGAKNIKELKNIFKKSMVFEGVVSLAMFCVSILFAYPLSNIFVSYDPALLDMTTHGMRIYALSYLLCGFNMFASSLFTALNNGGVSAVLSTSRTLVFQIIAILVLPQLFGIDGIWFALVASELCTFLLCAYFVVAKRKEYMYY